MSVRKRKWTSQGVEREGWQADYVDAKDKRRRKMFRLKKEADAFLLTARTEVRDGTHVADAETITVEQAGRLWLKSGDAAGLERTSMDQRRQHLELHIVPIIGELKLNKLTVPGVRDFQDKLREGGRSAAMVKRVTVSLGSILADAQGRGLTVRNPVHEQSRSRSSSTAERRRAKARLQVGTDIPTGAEIKALLTTVSGRWRPLLVTMVFTGIRSSEARGLRWSDVDLDNAKLTVSQRADRYREIGAPKSEAGRRTVPLTPMVVNTLKAWKLACPKGELGLVFPNTEGGVEFHENMLQRGLWPAWIAAGITVGEGESIKPKYPGFHALRHWFASWCINRRADGGLVLPAKAVQERMGHGSIQVTFDTYGHMFPIADESAAFAAAEKHLFGT